MAISSHSQSGGVVIMAISLMQLGCSLFGIRTEENPKYEVVTKSDDVEIRSYQPYIVAKTTVQGEYRQAQTDAFRILAGYIFGGNEGKKAIAMTAPVQQTQADGKKIAMTAPVVQTATSSGWEMTFMMPSEYKMEDLPKPNDKRVAFAQVPSKTVAVLRFTGFAGEEKVNRKAQELKDWLEKTAQYKIVQGPSYAGYDPPWTIPFLRRHEVMFEVQPAR